MNRNNEEITQKKSKFGLIIGIMVCLALLFFSVYQIGVVSGSNQEIVVVKNVFADVNADGLQDLIVSAEVVLNQGF